MEKIIYTTKNSQQNPQPIGGGFVSIRAFAKINLFLDIAGIRSDGYHNIVSVMQPLSFGDDIEIRCWKYFLGSIDNIERKDQINLSIYMPKRDDGHLYSNYDSLSFTKVKTIGNLENSQLDNLPNDDRNLIVKAAKFMVKEYNIKHPLHIRLNKCIPMGAGLGGGSADCAATLCSINTLFNLGLSVQEIMDIGKTFGADVPFCVYALLSNKSKIAKIEGIGEKITSLPNDTRFMKNTNNRKYKEIDIKDCYVLLICPPIHVSTVEAYRLLDEHMADKKTQKSASNRYREYVKHGYYSNLYNAFTETIAKKHPYIKTLIEKMLEDGALSASMTGSGSAVFGLFENFCDAQKASINFPNDFCVITTLKF